MFIFVMVKRPFREGGVLLVGDDLTKNLIAINKLHLTEVPDLSYDVFVFNTNLAFPTFLYRIDIKGLKKTSAKNKVASTLVGIDRTPTPLNHLWIRSRCLFHSATKTKIRILTALTTQPPSYLLNRRSLNWTWIISSSIEHDFIRVWKSETGKEWQIGIELKDQSSIPLSHPVICWIEDLWTELGSFQVQ